jgi:small GTP-binding protein
MSEDPSEPIDRSKIRLGVFGGGGVGITAITLRYIHDTWIGDYVPILQDDFAKDITVSGKPIHLYLIDTAGQDDFREMRSSFYSSVHGFLLVYSVIDPNSLFGVEEIYKDILTSLVRDTIPCVLVGNKVDLKDEDSVSTEQGRAMAKKFGAKLVELSARTGENVDTAFEEGVRAVQRFWFKSNGGGGGGCCQVM